MAILILALSSALALGALEQKLPDFEMINQEGKPTRLSELKGKYNLVSFVFTRCPMPDMCPLTLKLNKSTFEKWKGDKQLQKEKPLRFVFVSLEPEFDKPSVLKKYAKDHSVDLNYFLFLTGKPKILSEFASQFNVVGLSNNGTISHNLKTVLLDPDLKVIKEFKENEWQPSEVIQALASP